MISRYEKVANQNSHSGYADADSVFRHTVDQREAEKLVRGYQAVIPSKAKGRSIDIGAGAGYITRAFNANGYRMIALEKSQDALQVFKRYSPEIEVIDGDIQTFHEPNAYDFIFSREVYLFTRVNSFSDQYRIISDLIDSVKPTGVFMLVASQRSWPNCTDFKLVNRYLKKEKKVRSIRMYSETLLKRFPAVARNYILYQCLEFLFRPVFAWLKRKKDWCNHLVIVYAKSPG